MKRNSKYWQKRFEQLEESRYKINDKVRQEVEREYERAIKRIEKEIRVFYHKFADNNGVTYSRAKKMLNARELKEFKWDVWEYIEKAQENAIEGNWIKELENASIRFRISRLEALELKIRAIVNDMENTVLEKVDNHITNSYQSTYYHTAFEIQKGIGVGWDIAAVVPSHIVMIKSKPWTADGTNFSKRIWGKHRPELIKYLEKELSQALIMGRHPNELVDDMAKKFNVTKKQASNLVMTESAYIASVAQKDCYNELDVEKYEIVATLDTKTSQTCRDLDGEVFNLSEYEPWVTAPPFHNFCRTVTAPYFEDSKDKRWYRDADGNTGYVDAKMKYNEWYDKYVKEGK